MSYKANLPIYKSKYICTNEFIQLGGMIIFDNYTRKYY